MSVSKLFFGDAVPLKRSELVAIVHEGIPGLSLVMAISLVALLIGEAVKSIDPLVAAIVLGMVVRTAIGKLDRVIFRVLPGMFLAQSVFVPLGIILYGKNLDLHVLAKTEPLVAVQTALLALLSMGLLYGLARLVGLRDRFGILLGFGSAVCGASAIAITTPICECEPDETAAGLVTNTIAVLVAVAGLEMFLRHSLSGVSYAAMAGELLHQTGAVKMVLADMSADLQKFGMAVKSLRVAFLLILIPAVSVLLRRGLYFPWYLLLFAAVGVFFSFVPVAPGTVSAIGTIHNVCFGAALASVGMNASLGSVLVRIPKPLLLVLGVFAIDAGIFLATEPVFLR